MHDIKSVTRVASTPLEVPNHTVSPFLPETIPFARRWASWQKLVKWQLNEKEDDLKTLMKDCINISNI